MVLFLSLCGTQGVKNIHICTLPYSSSIIQPINKQTVKIYNKKVSLIEASYTNTPQYPTTQETGLLLLLFLSVLEVEYP